MNRNIDKAILDIAKVSGILYAMENAFDGIQFSPDSLEEASHCINTFYALIDAVHKVEEDLDRAAADESIVDALTAARSICAPCKKKRP